MVQDELRNKSTGIITMNFYAAGRLVAVNNYCLKHKFESIGQLVSIVYTEV